MFTEYVLYITRGNALVYGISMLNGLLTRLLNLPATVGVPLGAKLGIALGFWKFSSGLDCDCEADDAVLLCVAKCGDKEALECLLECLDLVDSMSVSSLRRGLT